MFGPKVKLNGLLKDKREMADLCQNLVACGLNEKAATIIRLD